MRLFYVIPHFNWSNNKAIFNSGSLDIAIAVKSNNKICMAYFDEYLEAHISNNLTD